MKKMTKKSILLLAALAALLLAGVGGTVAYIVTQTPSITNTFESAYVDVTAEQSGDGYSFTNNGNIAAYIRVQVIPGWKNAEGTVYASTPAIDASGDGWKSQDGFFYYTSAVGSQQQTTALTINGADAVKPADGYELQLNIQAQGVQAEPSSLVTQLWGWTPPADNAE